jgi:TonB family protein
MRTFRSVSSAGVSLVLLMSAHRVYAQPGVAVASPLPAPPAPAMPPVAAPSPASPTPPAPTAPTPAGPTLVAPSLKTHGDPVYPPEALASRLEGTVGLELELDATGKVVSAKVTSFAGHGFDEAAVASARQFVFAPATRDGVPIASSVQFAYEFHLPKAPPPVVPPPAPPVVPAVQTGANQTTLILAQRPPNVELEHISASDSSTSHAELSLVPRLRAEGMLEVVPGLFSVQHAGGGKAQQYFLRGFDADHGTDIAFSVDGTPINAVSHGHGQGFSDLHFLIPEVVQSVDATKGPYSARVGDFATAGSVSFHMADHVDESLARLEVGSTGHQRVVVVESPDLGKDWRMAVAAEAFHEDGPFIHPDNFDRLNGYLKATRKLDDHSEASVMMMAYGGSWSMSGVLPARAVCGEADGTAVPSAYAGSHCISRWDSVDPSQGGQVQRVELATSYRRWMGPLELEAMVFVLHSNFQLFPNDGIAASFQPEGVKYGSQVEQDDIRTESGANIRLSHKAKLAGMDVKTTFGIQIRDDAVESQLHRTEDRVRLDGVPGISGPITDSQIGETELAAYAEADFRPAKWLRFVTGARFDRVDAGVNNESATAVDKVSGYAGAQLASPKATVIVSPVKELDLFANYGRGFHSNDARTLIEGSATTLLSAASGYETGTTIRPFRGLSLSAVAFLIDIQSELTIDGDTASTSPSGPVQRYGGEFTGRYDFDERVFASAALTVTHARYTDAADVSTGMAYVPLAPVRTFAAGVGARQPIGKFTLIGSLNTRSMSDRPATQNWSPNGGVGLTATGFTMFDGELGLRWKNVELLCELLNIGDVLWREGQFAVDSRLPGEGDGLPVNPSKPVSKANPVVAAPPTGMSFTPGIPRTIMGHATVYW